MICYRDMTFCTGDGCKKFGPGCGRSLTEIVKAGAAKWWGGDGSNAPIARFAEPKKLSCYEPPDEEQVRTP